MEIKLHKLARTMPATRAYRQKSTRSAAQLSRELGLSQRAGYQWWHAGRLYDASHARHHLGASPSATDEAIIAEMRQRLRLLLDDIVAVLNRCLPKRLSRNKTRLKCLGYKAPLEVLINQAGLYTKAGRAYELIRRSQSE